ncbi:MAG TPA: hypothetical protein VGK73_12625 [Polyangiaceae bacterium]
MPCLIGCLALVFPRLALVLLWLFGGDYLGRAYESWIFPVLGFVFLPLTTLAFAFGMNSLGSPTQMEPLGWVLVALAAAADLGLIGRGAKDAQGYRERDRDGWRRPGD